MEFCSALKQSAIKKEDNDFELLRKFEKNSLGKRDDAKAAGGCNYDE